MSTENFGFPFFYRNEKNSGKTWHHRVFLSVGGSHMASFDQALSYTGINEGGFQKNPNDPGNWYNGELLGTRWGISAPIARAHGYLGRMEDLPKSFADSIYRSTYWPGLEPLTNQAIATKIFDMRVNFGVDGGSRLAQTALNNLGVWVDRDGMIGPATRAAIESLRPAELMAELCRQQEQAYRADAAQHPEKQTFLAGWIDRARKIPPGLIVTAAAASYATLGFLVLSFLLWTKK
jgi:lysozyme family protein